MLLCLPCLQRRLLEEYERCQQYLDLSTRKLLITTVERQLIRGEDGRHISVVLDRGFSSLMDGQRLEDLARLFSLCSRVAALDALRAAFRDYIKSSGIKIIKEEDKVRCGAGRTLRCR